MAIRIKRTQNKANSPQIIDVTNAEAFLVRKNGDGGDVFNVSTGVNGDITMFANGTGKLVLDRDIEFTGPQKIASTANGLITVNGGTAGLLADDFLSVTNTTAPGAVADQVHLSAFDDAAANTIPAFQCEGTNVIATGQIDSASSVRVKMRINGTTVTLLAI